MASYLASQYHTLEVTNGKTKDIAYMYHGEPVVIFDISRTSCEPNYQVIEALKNGKVFSSKYNSRTKVFPAPFVLIFSNK